ncbi:hypothetical protein HWI77_11685 [Acinetobacter venetianus]|uniref:hypothetical protein n=1 Tax=Acinetobacter TaxID=469 RepID=UPI000235F48B|nr:MULTISPECIES: hypothetical protein [Acinetobacter]KXZ71722.1 hypothetical protein AVENLUH8758_01632 [Acinetobacter venetianus]QNH50376.1 hypothetical protein HWI77_11685 [Acinetobacter venetianus]GAB00759.1 hypothetical protein ACT4_012_00140 [Acinetobacter sp. NBRC 100985]
MNKKDFRAKLYQTYIASGMRDHSLIQEYIKAAESFVFHNSQITVSRHGILDDKSGANKNPTMGSRALGNNEHPSNHIVDSGRNCIETSGDTATNHLTKMIEDDRAIARSSLKLIYQHQFATVDELVQHMARLAYGDACLKIDPLENLTEAGKILRENGNDSSRSFCEE